MVGARIAVAALALSITGCARSSCPPGHRSDEARTRTLTRLLERDPEASSLLSSAGDARWCYRADASGVISNGTLLLDERADDRLLAARAAHLLLHKSRGAALTTGHPADPEEQAARALEARVASRLEQAR